MQEELNFENEYIKVIEKLNYIIFNIKKDISFETYLMIKNINKIKNITSLISSNILMEDEKIKNKKIYLIQENDSIFNIDINDNIIKVDIKTKYKNGYINEYIVEINKETEEYKVINMKHDDNYSTYYIGQYSSENKDIEYFHISKYDALKIFKKVIIKLSEIKNIDEIINLEELFGYLFDKEYKLDNKLNVVLNMTLF